MTLIDFESLSYFLKIVFITQFIRLITVSIGIVANLLTFLVYQRSRFRNQSFCIYAKWKTFVDNFYLFTALSVAVAYLFNANIDTVAPFFCTLNSRFVGTVTLIFSQILLVCISADRLLVILYPNRFMVTRKLLFQLTVIVGAGAFSFGLFASSIIDNTIIWRVSRTTNMTSLFCQTNSAAGQLSNTFNLIAMLVFTLIINNSLTVALVVGIHRSRNRVFNRANLNRDQIRNARKDKKFAINSIAFNITSFVLKLPSYLWLFMRSHVAISADQNTMIIAITTMINIDNAVPLFVNIFTNSIFRSEFLAMFRLDKRRHQRSKTTNTNSVVAINRVK